VVDHLSVLVQLGGAPDGARLRVGGRAPVERLAGVLEGKDAGLGLAAHRLTGG